MKKGFTQISNPVIRSEKKLTDAEFRLYCTLRSFDFKNGFVFPSRETLAKHMGCSRAKIDRVKSSLEKKGGFRKKRRGQGITNLYFLNRDFLPLADDSSMSPAGNSQVSGKEDEVENTFNNYLPTSLPFKETTFGENPNLGTVTQPLSQPYKEKAVGVTTELSSVSQPKQKDPRIILLGNLNRVKTAFEERNSKHSPEQLEEEYLSLNTKSCVKGIQYYFWKYKTFFGKEHPLLKLKQLDNCFENFNWMVWKIENNLDIPPSKIDEVIERAIDRWFGTTTPVANNLNLNHFAGITKKGTAYSEVLERSVEEVLYELGILSNAPKVVHLEDVI